MGFFQKIFGKTNLPELTSEMLDEDRFWKIVEESLESSGGNQDLQESSLVSALENLSPKDIIGFRLTTDKLLYDTYNSEMWCAGYIVNGGCSDDGFEYFRLWVISRGKEVYYAAKEEPDSLVAEVGDEIGSYSFESFWYVGQTAFENITGHDLYDYIDNDNFIFNEGNYPEFDFTWSEEEPESMERVCPRLFKRYIAE